MAGKFTLETTLDEFINSPPNGVSLRLHRLYWDGNWRRSSNDDYTPPQTIGDLCQMTAPQIRRRCYEVGNKSLRELSDLLAEHGFSLREEHGRHRKLDHVEPSTPLRNTSLSTRAILAANRVLHAKTVGDLTAKIRGGRRPAGLTDGIWTEITTKMAGYGLLDEVTSPFHYSAIVALVRQLQEQWNEEAASVVADWCEERGLLGAALYLRCDPNRPGPNAYTRASIEALACCLGISMIPVRVHWAKDWLPAAEESV